MPFLSCSFQGQKIHLEKPAAHSRFPWDPSRETCLPALTLFQHWETNQGFVCLASGCLSPDHCVWKWHRSELTALHGLFWRCRIAAQGSIAPVSVHILLTCYDWKQPLGRRGVAHFTIARTGVQPVQGYHCPERPQRWSKGWSPSAQETGWGSWGCAAWRSKVPQGDLKAPSRA